MMAATGGRGVRWGIRGCGGRLAKASFLSLVLAALPAHSWAGSAPPPSFPCIDVNHNGICERGVDTDISDDVKSGFVSASGDVLIPPDGKGITLKADLYVFTDGRVTMNSRMKASSIMFSAGSVEIGPGATIEAHDSLDISGDSGVVIGARAELRSTNGTVYVSSLNGDVVFGPSARVTAKDGIDVFILGEGLTVHPGGRWRADHGPLSVYSAGDMSVNGSQLEADSTSMFTESHVIEFRNNTVHVSGHGGSVTLMAEGSTIDVRGTRFRNVDPSNVTISAETVLQ